MARRVSGLAWIAAAVLGFAPAAGGQGRVLGATSTIVGVPTVVHAIGVGILSMLIPVVVIMVAIILLVRRRARAESASH